MSKLSKITIKGYKSIQNLENFNPASQHLILLNNRYKSKV